MNNLHNLPNHILTKMFSKVGKKLTDVHNNKHRSKHFHIYNRDYS